MKKSLKVYIQTLGCARNIVDSQLILGDLKKQGYSVVNDLENADLAVVNTCGFIENSKRESIDAILDLIELKQKGKLKKIVVAGCLSERYGKTLKKEFSDVDIFKGVRKLEQKAASKQVCLTPKHFSYIKICESCFNNCNFCIIPKIKGKFISRTFESVVKESKVLDKQEIKELNIIGQDITSYGVDIYHEKQLAELIRKILFNTKGIEWLRLLYTYPLYITDDLIDLIASEKRICSYIDVPLQHISESILKKMNRNMSKKYIIDLIQKIRKKIKNVAIRTAFIVGLPGESEKDFNELLNFVKDTRFDKLGAFIYSREEGTKAFSMPHQISEKIKMERYKELMELQQKISIKNLKNFIGRRLKVLVNEKVNEKMRWKNHKYSLYNNIYLARSEYDAPDVDGLVYVYSKDSLKIGSFAEVKIIDSYEYDLVGISK